MASVSGTVYTRENCDLCDDAIETLRSVASEEDVDLSLSIVDVDEDPELREEYGERVPYVLLDDRPAFKYSVDPVAARSTLRALADE
ncbi:glutaredoxin family protein [Salinarchaeum laminariae]|uniref:glutaredoxin family protein n=1 Tax=Salinarchaeum laminariae TaxID=869888 RepID=UPI0020BE86BB|nr:glutaredoxin family protein [Salinarchaeum laminariae]